MNIAEVSDFQLAVHVYSIPEYKAAFPTFVLPAPTFIYNLSRKCFQLLPVSYDASCGFIMHSANCFEVLPSILHLFSILIMRECWNLSSYFYVHIEIIVRFVCCSINVIYHIYKLACFDSFLLAREKKIFLIYWWIWSANVFLGILSVFSSWIFDL